MKRNLLLGSAALALILAAAPAFAEDQDSNADIVNGQLNLGDVGSNLNVGAYNIWGDVSGTSAAIANSFSAELGGDAVASNFQRTNGNVASELNATLDWIEGDVTLTSAAVGNTASVINEPYVPCEYESECPAPDGASLDLTNTQLVNVDPSAWLNISAWGVGEVNGTAAAISNSLSVEAWNQDTTVNTWQATRADTTASVNATISGATGVDLTAAAVGNTVSIDNLMN